jgi:hypothetical protein
MYEEFERGNIIAVLDYQDTAIWAETLASWPATGAEDRGGFYFLQESQVTARRTLRQR